MTDNDCAKGSCLCGEVTLSVKKFERQALGCHCQQCRKQTGSYVIAANALDSNLEVKGAEHLTWFAASKRAKRGFCSKCGSLLLWKMEESERTSIMAGCFESPTGLSLIGHIFTADKGDYYSLDDGLPQYPGSGNLSPDG